MPLSSQLKHLLLATISRLTGRHAVLLPAEAGSERAMLRSSGPYRIEGEHLEVALREPGTGRLRATLRAYRGSTPNRTLWSGARDYPGPCSLSLDLAKGEVRLNGEPWGQVPLPVPGRRLSWLLEIDSSDGRRCARTTGHYLPGSGAIGADYFAGGNYVDHEADSAGEHPIVIDHLRRHGARSPILEVGCASGGLLEALDRVDMRGYGADVSAFAVERAEKRLGPGRVWCCDADRDPLPADLAALGPFGTLLLWNVLEHFSDPFGTLERLTPHVRPGGLLLLATANADGLSHKLFGRQWEGHFDWTHAGIDDVGARNLRTHLPRFGWRIEKMSTYLMWDANADPTHATLRDWWAYDARFRLLLAELELGDLLTCVAVKE